MADSRTRGGREIVEFSLKGPVCVNINDEQICSSGCSVLDLSFATPSQIGEVCFRNYYTMWLSVHVKIRLSPDTTGTNIGSVQHTREENISDWITSIPKKVLMEDAHYEAGSHDMISICSSESNVEWKDLVAMRLVLRQPSPVWRTFHIEEINVYKDLPRITGDSEAESLIMLIKKQTLEALRWMPTQEGQCQTGAYEFTNLPLP